MWSPRSRSFTSPDRRAAGHCAFYPIGRNGARAEPHIRAQDDLGYLIAAGLTTQLAAYAFVNLGVATGLFPTTGLPLPFISYGGSALVLNLAAAGILVNISSQAQAKGARVESEPAKPRRVPNRNSSTESAPRSGGASV